MSESNNKQIITVEDKIHSLIEVVDGASKSTLSLEEKENSVSKNNIFTTSYEEVKDDESYDDSAEAIKDMLEKFRAASEEPGNDPIKQNGFAERLMIGSNEYDVGLIKCVNAVCNNATTGTYQTIRFTWRQIRYDPDIQDTFEKQYDLDLTGKSVVVNRPDKTDLNNGLITKYSNPDFLTLSITLPLTGNDQDMFDEDFQDKLKEIVAYGTSATLAEIMEHDVDSTDLAREEMILTSRAITENKIRNMAVARYPSKTEDEIEEVVDQVYPAVADAMEKKPLTSKAIEVGVYVSLVEKSPVDECEWTSTSRKWKYYSAGSYNMRYRPIANSRQTFPVTDKVLEEIEDYGEELLASFIDYGNGVLCSHLGLENIDSAGNVINLPDYKSKLSDVLGINPKELFTIRRDVISQITTEIKKILDQRDENVKTETMGKLAN